MKNTLLTESKLIGNFFSNGIQDRDRDSKFDQDRDRDRDRNFCDRGHALGSGDVQATWAKLD